ncbi:MAG: tRNA (5-methylaminomethyl-2-thiouridine)(34)-methyltransferase MnmD [Owenweeksia sp.]|nr:tRNA (5-methylaminomethyl-2-thiouridine)(34)-methyltransferase MnmD [Owenweeksia sp.]
MNRQVVQTKDGSSSLFVPELDEHYHSVHGALQESQHVFIAAGLQPLIEKSKSLSLLEVGLGTGLNAWLTLQQAEKAAISINYHALEKYPVTAREWQQLNYQQLGKTKMDATEYLSKIHEARWESWQSITPHFKLYKQQVDLRQFAASASYQLIYFDAFAPSAQPELWTAPVFERLYNSLKPNGCLVTYCVKGEVRRNMKAAGFRVKKNSLAHRVERNGPGLETPLIPLKTNCRRLPANLL